jgi:orotate phosphoribosyltransferase
MPEEEILAIFNQSRALLKGHFQLSSGLHSEQYLQCALVLQYPAYAEKLCRELAREFLKERPNVVIGPALGAVSLAYEMARALSCRGIFTERENAKMTLRRNFQISPAERVLVVEDVLTTGGSVMEVIELVKSFGGQVIGVASLINRAKELGLPYKTVSLLKLEIPTYKPEECPLCKKGIALTKPGSRPKTT